MADQNVRVASLPDNGAARVAYDLMVRIANVESPERKGGDPRSYYLDLFKACRERVY